MSSKQKRAISLIGITGAVYFVVRYLLPLAVPFLAGWIIARIVWPFARFVYRHTRLSLVWGGIVGILILGTSICGILWIVGGKLLRQLLYFMENLPQYLEMLYRAAGDLCSRIEGYFHLPGGCVLEKIIEIGGRMQEEAVGQIMPYLMSSSLPFLSWAITFFSVSTIAVISAIMIIQERERIRAWKEKSAFRREIAIVTKRLGEAGGAYVKTELTIMSITMAICMAGLTFIGNNYGVLIGALIGIVDVLPIFGSGTIFVPWILWEILKGNLGMAFKLGIIYLICYVVREWLEARILASSTGMGGLESLISMYVGLKLFGILGLFLGPIAWILIKEIDKIYNLA